VKGVVAYLLAFTFFTVLSVQANEKPNIVVIMTDNQGYGDLGCYGGVLKQANQLTNACIGCTHADWRCFLLRISRLSTNISKTDLSWGKRTK